ALRRHATSTLFPYTTLFRSEAEQRVGRVARDRDDEIVVVGDGECEISLRRRWRIRGDRVEGGAVAGARGRTVVRRRRPKGDFVRSEEHTSELQSHLNLVCRL